MTIKFRKYIVEFELRTEDDDPDELFNNYLDGIEISSKNSIDRIKVTSIRRNIPRIGINKCIKSVTTPL